MRRLAAVAGMLLSTVAMGAAEVGSSRGDARPTALLVTGGQVLAPAGDSWLVGRDILLQDGHITSIVPAGTLLLPAGALGLDATGMFVIPGLIDLHTHLLLHPYDETPWDDQVLRQSLELRTLRGAVAGRATLAAGFTTIRDLGTEGAAWADVALREAFATGMHPGPRLLASTRAIVAVASYGPAGFDPRWDLPTGAQEANGVDGVRQAVREQVAAGADWIKVYADYRRRPGAEPTPTFSQAELEALVDEARAAGLPVAAHAASDAGIRRAVLAGVESIEHGTGASDEVLALMREQGTVLCPTLAAGEAMARYGGWQPGQPEPQRLADDRALMARALRSGVTIACGSDGVARHALVSPSVEEQVAEPLAVRADLVGRRKQRFRQPLAFQSPRRIDHAGIGRLGQHDPPHARAGALADAVLHATHARPSSTPSSTSTSHANRYCA
jgi:imidazolonepropionase-like amidohydrolase